MSEVVRYPKQEYPMSIPMTSKEVLDREFLEMRAKALELAACLDRLQRAEGDVQNDPRVINLKKAIDVLAGNEPDRAEQIQQIFSRSYEANWREQFAQQAAGEAAPAN